MPTLQTLNFILASGAILAFVLGCALLIDRVGFRGRYFGTAISRNGLSIAAISALAATAMTLVYSEVYGIVPCGLCWLQRVALFAQALILPIAAYLKDSSIALYGAVLSGAGMVVALYHHYLQMGGSTLIGCPTTGVDCAKRIVFEFGFITFPLAAAGLFFFLLVLFWSMQRPAR